MVLSPLLMVLVYVVVFFFILRVRLEPNQNSWEYLLTVFCGLLPWLGFSEGLTKGTSSVLANRGLIKASIFPVEFIPVSTVLASLSGQLFSMAVLLIMLMFTGHMGLKVLLLPLIVGLQILLTVGLVWFLSCINVVYRDTSQVLVVLVMVLMFLSPIAYTESMVPSGLKPFLMLNPLYYLIDGYRGVLLMDHAPNVWVIVGFGILSVFVFLAGHRFFMRLKVVFADLV
jgi:lipopolysaccharide transport system permease protein